MFDTLFILAPLLGLAANVPVQLLAGRLDPRHRVLRSAAVGLVFGGGVCLAVTIVTAPETGGAFWPGAANLAVNAASYLAFGFCYWNFLNLGAGSIRMRIFDELDAHPDGLSKEELHERYNDDKLVKLRLERMKTNSLIVEENGRFFVRRRWLVLLAAAVRATKIMILGRASQFSPRDARAAGEESASASSPSDGSPTRVSSSSSAGIFDKALAWAVRSMEQSTKLLTRGRITAAAVLLVHLVVLLLCARVAFTNHEDMLLHTMDGATECCLIRLQQEWMPLGLAMGNNPLAGLGNVFAFVNTRMMPCFALSTYFGDPSTVAIYTICAVELFVAILVLGACLGMSQGWRLFTAWSATVYTLPFVWPQKYLNLSDQDPHHVEMQAAALVSFGMFYLVGKGGVARSLLAALASYLCVVFMAVTQPQWFLVSIPVFVVVFLTFLAFSSSPRERWHKAAVIGLMVAVSLPTVLPYLAGSVLNSVPAFFSGELRQVRGSILLTSILFHEDGYRYGQYLWIGSLIGALIVVFSRHAAARPLAAATLAGHATVLLAIVVTRYVLADYHGPPVLYMEIYLWPLFFVFGCRLLVSLAASPMRRGLEFASDLLRKIDANTIRLQGTSPAWTFGLLILPAVLTARSFKSGARPFDEWPRPTPKTAITDYLHSQVGLDSGDGSPFRGAVATFVGYEQTRMANWHTLVGTDYVNVVCGGGNQHRGLGFWEHNIPTLFDYNYLVPPAFYATTTRLLTRPADSQERNLILFSKPETRYLASLGVRFLVTDFAMPHLSKRLQVPTPHVGATQFVYEIEDANLGDYSPTTWRRAADADEAIRFLTEMDFSFKEEAVVLEEIPQPLEKARVRDVSVSRRGMRVDAQSGGVSLLVLPLPYSNCLKLHSLTSDSKFAPRLVRVNLSQTGLLFSKKIDATIQYSYGPFDNSFGMLADYFELKKLGLGRIPDYRDQTPPGRIETLVLRRTKSDLVRAAIKSVRTYDRVPGREAGVSEQNLVDGDPVTAWSSPQQPVQVMEEIILELAEVQPVTRVRWLAAEAGEHVAPANVEIQLSKDGRSWSGVSAESVALEKRGRWHVAVFPPVEAQQVKLNVLTRRDQVKFYTKIAEFVVECQTADVPSLELSWTAPRDADSPEGVYEYDVRWSPHPIVSEDDFQSAHPLLDLPPVWTKAGEVQSMPVQPWDDHLEAAYFAVAAVDRARNTSAISNNATIATSDQGDGPPDRMAARPGGKRP